MGSQLRSHGGPRVRGRIRIQNEGISRRHDLGNKWRLTFVCFSLNNGGRRWLDRVWNTNFKSWSFLCLPRVTLATSHTLHQRHAAEQLPLRALRRRSDRCHHRQSDPVYRALSGRGEWPLLLQGEVLLNGVGAPLPLTAYHNDRCSRPKKVSHMSDVFELTNGDARRPRC